MRGCLCCVNAVCSSLEINLLLVSMAEKLPEHFAIDFGNHTIKAVQLSDLDSKTPSLTAFGSVSTPFGVLNSENEVHVDRLVASVKDLMKEANIKTHNVIAAIPESVVSTRFLTLRGVKPNELNEAVYWDTKQTLPIPVEDVNISHMIVGEKKDDDELLILRVAATKKIIETYKKVLQKAGLEALTIETEGVAIARLVKHSSSTDSAVVLDFGSQTTDMSIVKDGMLIFSQSISTGSDALTRAIMTDFSLEYNQAEQYKRKYGLDKTQLEGKIVNSLDPIMKIIVGEVVRGVEFFKSQTGFSSPKDVFLVGDGSLLPGLVEYLTTELGMSATLIDSWQNIKIKEGDKAVLDKGKSAYAVAVGLALRNYN